MEINQGCLENKNPWKLTKDVWKIKVYGYQSKMSGK
jgi:hypothetical protein